MAINVTLSEHLVELDAACMTSETIPHWVRPRSVIWLAFASIFIERQGL
jgi:hypothetical protein